MSRLSIVRTVVAAALALLAARPAAAQFGPHPAFQPAQLTSREYNFGLAGDDATSFVFQWREGLSARSQLGLDVGFAEFDGPGDFTVLFGGATLAVPLVRSTADLPLDLTFQGGAGLMIGDEFSQLRVPIGLVVGHRFTLDRQIALAPFVHPRLAVAVGDGEDVDAEFDLGAELILTPRLSTRLAIRLGDLDAVGISLALRAPGLSRR